MVFSSVVFLFYFLPAVLLLTVLARRAGAANWVLLLASLSFYAYGETDYVLLLVAVVVVVYVAAFAVQPDRPRWQRRAGLALGVTLPLAALAYFKYAGFALTNLQAVFPSFHAAQSWLAAALPLGISFFVFQALSYVVDVHRGQVAPERHFSRLLLYKAFFPQLIAGPIVRYHEVAAQLAIRKMGLHDLQEGAFRFTKGLAKKVLIANPLGLTVDTIFALPAGEMSFELAWAGCLLFALQLYFDFSGYSDMAIGLARMFGFRFPENFSHPYVAQSVRDFWQRWHMTLSRWLRDYVYIPLGGNRGSPARTYLNLLIVFGLCGLWHGAAWTFVAWGFVHGIFLILERLFLGRLLDRSPRIARHAYTLLVVGLAWVLFRAQDFEQALVFYRHMFSPWTARFSLYPLEAYFSTEVVLVAGLAVLFSMPLRDWLLLRLLGVADRCIPAAHAVAAARLTLMGAGLVVCAMSLSAQTHNPFLYFRF